MTEQIARGGWFERTRRMITGAALLGIGCSIGLVVGTVSNIPELLLSWASREGTTVELAAPGSAAPAPARAAELQEFPKLQEPAKASAPSSPAIARVPPVAAAPPPAPAERPVATPAAKPEPPAPAKDVVVASLAKKGAPAPPGAVVQVAAYSDARAADALVRRLRGQGLDAYVSDQKPDGQQRYRVRVRPAAGQDPRQLAAKLGQSGLSVWVTRE